MGLYIKMGHRVYNLFLVGYNLVLRNIVASYVNGTAMLNSRVRNAFTIGQKNVIQKPIVDTEKIILPPLHIKLGLAKNLIEAMKKDKPGFCYLKRYSQG